MGRFAADALFGAEAVDHALAEPAPDPVTSELAEEVGRRKDPPGALRAWALAQPWPRFCAIVRMIAGVAKDDLLQGADDE